MYQWIQPAALLIVVLYVLLQFSRERAPRRFLWQLFLTGFAAWLAEESAIRLYGFYDYSDGWWVKVGHVPLLVLMIWPIVIHSAINLARQLRSAHSRPTPSTIGVALPAGLFVLADAALIEPVAVHAGLWHWTEPGIFEVPPIGILGWFFYSVLCAAVLHRTKTRSPVWDLLVLPITLAGTHLLLIASWWGLLRWVNVPLPPDVVATLVVLLSLLLSFKVWRAKVGRRVLRRDLLMRVPAALYFGALLLAHWPGFGALFFYFAAFTPPNIILTLQASSSPSGTGESP